MTEKQVREMLRKEVEKAGSQRAWADAAGVSHALVSHVLAGSRDPAGRVLDALGVERVVSYRWKAKSYE